jgi:hypothetical protein
MPDICMLLKHLGLSCMPQQLLVSACPCLPPLWETLSLSLWEAPFLCVCSRLSQQSQEI